MSVKTLRIGIGGVSRSYKTTLSEFLAKKLSRMGLRVQVLHQDDFVFPKEKIPTIHGKTDWETPASINFRKYRKAILDQAHDVVIAEGLLNFFDPETFELFDKKIFCEISKATFLHRKSKDTRWGIEPNWYIEHIWESYEKYGRTLLMQEEDFLKIDCETKKDFEKALNYILLEIDIAPSRSRQL